MPGFLYVCNGTPIHDDVIKTSSRDSLQMTEEEEENGRIRV